MSPNPVPAIIGRERELAKVRRIVDGLRTGTGTLLLLSGEAGIGKTLLAQALVDEATGQRTDDVVDGAELARAGGANERPDRGRTGDAPDDRPSALHVDAAWGRPLQRIVSPALWPWRQLANGIATRRPGGPMARLRAVLDDAAPPSDGEHHPTAEAIVVETAAELIRAEAAVRPLVLVVDDVNRYDELSLTLLETLLVDLARHPIVVVATARTSGGFEGAVGPGDGGDIVGRLARVPATVHLPLGRLQDDGIRRLVGAVAGPLDPQRAAQVVELAHGNPMFAVELARAVRHAAFDGPQAGHLVERLMAERVASVDGGGVVGALALVGRAASAPLLAAVVGEVVPNVARVLERAAAAGIVTRDGTTLGTYRLVHPLYGDAAVANLSGAEISELHHRIAEALSVDPTRVGPHTVEVARHLVAAGDRRTSPMDGSFGERFPERRARADAHFVSSLAEVCRDAARWSESIGDLDAAGELARAALAFDTGDAALRVDLLRVAGRLAASAADRRAAFDEAVATSRSLGADAFADTVIDLASIPPADPVDAAAAMAALGEALDGCGATQQPRRARLLALRAELLHRRDTVAATALWEQAAALAADLDAETLSFVLGAAVRMMPPQDATGRLTVLADRLEALGARTADVVTARAAGVLARGNRRSIGDLVAADFAGSPGRSARPTPPAVLLRATYAALLGDRDGFELARTALDGPGPTPWGDAHELLDLLALFDRWHAGEPLDPSTAEGRSGDALGGLLDLARGVLEADADADDDVTPAPEDRHPTAATDGSRPRGSVDRPDLVWDRAHDPAWAASFALRARAAWLDRDGDAVVAHLEPLRDHLDALALVGHRVAIGPVGWFVAEPAAFVADHTLAAEAISGAENAARRIGSDPWLARILLTRARLAPVLEPGLGLDHQRTLVLEAARFATRIGARGVECAAASLLDTMTTRRLPLGLTAREHDVLRLAASGASNVEIARRLHVSVKTVERHFTTLFRRLGVRNRAEAVAMLSRDLPL